MKQHGLKGFFMQIHGVEKNQRKAIVEGLVGDILNRFNMERICAVGFQSEDVAFHGKRKACASEQGGGWQVGGRILY
jgi:hypothetical protein